MSRRPSTPDLVDRVKAEIEKRRREITAEDEILNRALRQWPTRRTTSTRKEVST